MDFQTIVGVVGIALVIGLVQVGKNALGLSERYAPLAALALGLVLALGFKLQYGVDALPWFDTAIQGLILGLSASGLYSGATTTINGASLVRSEPARGNLVVLLPHPNGPDAKASVVTAVAQAQPDPNQLQGSPGTISATVDSSETPPVE